MLSIWRCNHHSFLSSTLIFHWLFITLVVLNVIVFDCLRGSVVNYLSLTINSFVLLNIIIFECPIWSIDNYYMLWIIFIYYLISLAFSYIDRMQMQRLSAWKLESKSRVKITDWSAVIIFTIIPLRKDYCGVKDNVERHNRLFIVVISH